jgi:aspartate carbamoyltransferase catalytic subunit
VGDRQHRLAKLKDDAIVMHPGPMNRGIEISGDVADSDRAVITEQVANGTAVRMACLYLLLAGRPSPRPGGGGPGGRTGRRGR